MKCENEKKTYLSVNKESRKEAEALCVREKLQQGEQLKLKKCQNKKNNDEKYL